MITLSSYRRLNDDQKRSALSNIYRDNLRRLLSGLGFCRLNGIRLYRMPSGLFPMSDEPLGEALLRDMAGDLALVGRLVHPTMWSIRTVMHPDQFVVLNSSRPEVTAQSVAILEKQALWLDLMGLERSPWAAMIVHGGVRGRARELAATIATLPEAVRSRLVLENDEFSYSAAEILEVCRCGGLPMVFDAHHHLVKSRLGSYDDPSMAAFMDAAARTWTPPHWAIVHISNGLKSLHDRRHSNFIRRMPDAFRRAAWIEVEAKAKERAIERLRRTWLSRRPKSLARRSGALPSPECDRL